MSKPKVSTIQTRAATLELIQPEAEGGEVSIRAALSSETPVKRIYGHEVLRHSAEAIDLSRAAEGLPLTVNHSEIDIASPDLPVGRVRNVHLAQDGKLRGDIVFDSDERSQAVRGKVERGFAPDVSITYRVNDFTGPDEQGTVVATRWMPTAASIVTVPADMQAGIGRSLDTTEADMPDETKPEAGGASIVETVQSRSQAGFQAGIEDATRRFNAIQDVTDQLSRAQPHLASLLADLAREARQDPKMTIDQFRANCLSLFGTDVAPANPADSAHDAPSQPAFLPPGDGRRALIQPGADQSEKTAQGMELALFARFGGRLSEDESRQMEGNEWRGAEFFEVARHCVEAAGINLRHMTREQIVRTAFTQGSRAISPGTAYYKTSDFTSVTANVITKLMVQGYSEAPVTFGQWCSEREVPDFKQFTLPRLSAVDSLPTVAENVAYTNLSRVDENEAATLVKHGGLFSLSWEAVLNGDGAFADTAMVMGEAAARTVDQKAYAVLTDNNNMGDGNPLFDAINHSNSGTAALDQAGIVATRTAMARQTDDNGEAYYAMLRYVIVPEELRDTADNLAGSEYLPWPEATPGSPRVNTLRGSFEVVPTIRLTDVNDWYAASTSNTVEIAYLAGNRMPALFREDGWDTDALHWKIRHPSVAYARNWRGLYRNVVT